MRFLVYYFMVIAFIVAFCVMADRSSEEFARKYCLCKVRGCFNAAIKEIGVCDDHD